MYEVVLERSAERDLKKLSEKIFRLMIEEIKPLTENPHPTGCRKIEGSKNDWRIRVGNYRILYEIDENEKRVKIMRVRHRKDVYRRLR